MLLCSESVSENDGGSCGGAPGGGGGAGSIAEEGGGGGGMARESERESARGPVGGCAPFDLSRSALGPVGTAFCCDEAGRCGVVREERVESRDP